MAKKQLTFEDLEPQYAAFCENARAVKQNTYWRTTFNKVDRGVTGEEETKNS